MKKLFLLLVLLAVSFTFVFGDNEEQEEVDYLLFLPNSSNQFADEARARIQLDNIARYLRTKTLTEAQVYVYGYTADVANDIDPDTLSRERALHVINELQRRGIPRSNFTAPVGHGSVNLWGNNITEDDRSPNRRVRILFEDIIITPEVVEEAEEEIIAFELAEEESAQQSSVTVSEDDGYNWWWLLLLLLPLLLLLWPKRRSKKPVTIPMQKKVTETKAALIRPEGGEPKYYRLTEEEIRNLAYKFYEERHQQHGFDETDWLNAIGQLFAKYEAQGYIVLWP
ncbi:MAG: OmpA family protein [Treponema sp.]|jgi:hypothetical protein|nr:OmpA family protein [Treponema sp.]